MRIVFVAAVECFRIARDQLVAGFLTFPRSIEAIRVLPAKLRGTASGFMVPETFQLLRERA